MPGVIGIIASFSNNGYSIYIMGGPRPLSHARRRKKHTLPGHAGLPLRRAIAGVRSRPNPCHGPAVFPHGTARTAFLLYSYLALACALYQAVALGARTQRLRKELRQFEQALLTEDLSKLNQDEQG